MDYTGVEEPKGFQAVPKGRYLAKVSGTEAKISEKGKPMIVLCGEIIDGPHAGRKFWDWIITGRAPGAPTNVEDGTGFGMKKMRTLGVDTSRPVPDEVICAELQDRQFAVELDVEPQTDKNGKIKTELDANGRIVALTRNTVVGYDTSGTRIPQQGASSTSYVHQAVQPIGAPSQTPDSYRVQYQGVAAPQPGVQYVQPQQAQYPAPPPAPNGYAQPTWQAVAADQNQGDLTVDGGQRRVRR